MLCHTQKCTKTTQFLVNSEMSSYRHSDSNIDSKFEIGEFEIATEMLTFRRFDNSPQLRMKLFIRTFGSKMEIGCFSNWIYHNTIFSADFWLKIDFSRLHLVQTFRLKPKQRKNCTIKWNNIQNYISIEIEYCIATFQSKKSQFYPFDCCSLFTTEKYTES